MVNRRLQGPSPDGDTLFRSVTPAVADASAVLEPSLVLRNAGDAAVRHLGACRVDTWLVDGRRTTHVASSGLEGAVPNALPAVISRGARSGVSHELAAADLGGGAGVEWRRMLDAFGAHAISVYPLVAGTRTIGAMTVISQLPFEAAEDAMSSFAHHVAATYEKAELHRAAQDAATTMRVQNRVLAELADERDVPSLRAAVEQLAADVLGDVAVALLPIDSLGRLTVPMFAPPSDGLLRVATEPEVDFASPVLTAGDAAIQLDGPGLRLCAALGLSALAGREQLDDLSIWGITLRRGGQVSGVLLVGLLEDDPVRATEARVRMVLGAMATSVAIALENAQLFAREHVRASRLSAANALARTVTTCKTREELHDAMVVGVRALFGYARVAAYGPDLASLADGGRAGRNVDHERALASTSMHRRRASRVERHDRTCHAIPLLGGERVQSVLYVEQPDTATPEQESDDLALLGSMCEHAAACLVAIEATERIERNYMDTIQALVHALEARDRYTADHSDEVAEWAVETGRRLGMNDDDLRDLQLGAILHDIGKVAVPDNILNKPDRLTAEEFEVMKSHTVIGERILQPIGFLVNVAPIVRHEHERWDGRGYPDGISGSDIPLASRIIFVCDAYHAITSDRPYRAGQSHAFARRIVTENAGTQFDPAVVSVFLDVIDSWCLDRGISTSDGDASGEEIVNPFGKLNQRPDTAEDARAA